MTDGVDPSVYPVKTTGGNPISDPAGEKTRRMELLR